MATRVRMQVLSVLFMLGVQACSSAPPVELYYPAHEPKKIDLPLPAPLNGQRPALHVANFVDERPWTRIGNTRTAWGFHTGVIEASTPVHRWFEESLASAMAKKGFQVGSAEQAQVYIEGKLREAFVAKRFFYEGKIKWLFIARCSCHDKILISKELEAQASLEGDREDAFAECMALLVDNAAERMADELEPIRLGHLHAAMHHRLGAR